MLAHAELPAGFLRPRCAALVPMLLLFLWLLCLLHPSLATATPIARNITDADLKALEGTGEVDVLYVAEGRWGDNGTRQTFELNLGESTAAPNAAQGQFAWGESGKPVDFMVAVDEGRVVFKVGDMWLSDLFVATPITDVFIRTRALDSKGVTGARSTVNDLSLDGTSLTGLESSASHDQADILHLSLSGLDEFVLRGTSTFAWEGTPTGALQSRIAYQIKFATSPTGPPVPEPTAAVVFGAGCFVLATGTRRSRRRAA